MRKLCLPALLVSESWNWSSLIKACIY